MAHLCDACGLAGPGYNYVHYGSPEAGHQQLCSKCFNMREARREGLTGFVHPDFTPVEIVDCTGIVHCFHFRTRLFPEGIALDAFEVHAGQPSGYQFQIIGESEDDPLTLVARLIERIRRALAVKHIEPGDYGPRLAGQVVRGRITSAGFDEHGSRPLLVVDGQDVDWEDFGRMLMTFEGFHFKLEIRDKSEEL